MGWTGEGKKTIIWEDTFKCKNLHTDNIFSAAARFTNIKVDHIAEKEFGHGVVIDGILRTSTVSTHKGTQNNFFGVQGKDAFGDLEDVYIVYNADASTPANLYYAPLSSKTDLGTAIYPWQNFHLSGDVNIGGDIKGTSGFLSIYGTSGIVIRPTGSTIGTFTANKFQFRDDKDFQFGTASANSAFMRHSTTNIDAEALVTGLSGDITGGDKSLTWIITSSRWISRDFEHDPQDNPTIFIHSVVAPTIDTTQWISFAHDQTDGQIRTGKGDLQLGEKTKNTRIGGFAIKLTNKTGSNSVAGQIVKASTGVGGTDDAFTLAGVNELQAIGIVLDSGISDGSEAWIVVSGIADVLVIAPGCTRGDRLITAATGSFAAVNNAPSVAIHFQEIGHCIETRAGAGLARCVLHFL